MLDDEPIAQDEDWPTNDNPDPPTDLHYGLLVEEAARVNLTAEFVREELAKGGMIVEHDDGMIMMFGENWPAVRAVRDAILREGVRQRISKVGKQDQAIFPEWKESEFRATLEALRERSIHELSEEIFGALYAKSGCKDKLTAKSVESLGHLIEGRIAMIEDRKFGALYGLSWPDDQVVPPDGIFTARVWAKTGGPPKTIVVEGVEYKRLDLIEGELDDESSGECDGNPDRPDNNDPDLLARDGAAGDAAGLDRRGDDAAADRNPDGDDASVAAASAAGLEGLCSEAQFAFDYLTGVLGWDERSHRLTAPEVRERIAAGSLAPSDLQLLVQLAEEEGWIREVEGEVVEGSTSLVRTAEGHIVNAEDGEVVQLCEMLGFTEEMRQNIPAFDQVQAEKFVEKIRMLQSSTIDIMNQARAMFTRNARAIDRGMTLFGPLLRAYAEPLLPRYKKDTKTKKAGDLKEHSVQLLTGDVIFKGSGGWKFERPYEAERWIATQLEPLAEVIQKMTEEYIATLPDDDPVKSIAVIDLRFKVDKKAALKAAEAGAKIPGIDYLPKHDTDKMMIGIERRPISLTKHEEPMKKALKVFKNACSQEDADND